MPQPPIAFFDFECTGRCWFALSIVVITIDKDLLPQCVLTLNIATKRNKDAFTPDTWKWWKSQKEARRYLKSNVTLFKKPSVAENRIATFIDFIRESYPNLQFATDNPTLDARYLDEIMDRKQRPRISINAQGKWSRVLAIDDLRQGFQLCGRQIQKRENCPLRMKIETLRLPHHVPEADVLNMAADYFDMVLSDTTKLIM